MKQYLDLLQNIVDNGVEKESGRANMPNTIGISHAVIKMDLQQGFPLLTTKKMYWKGIVHELLWFLRGDTNIKYLVDNNVNIWNGDAYRWYLKYFELAKIKLIEKYGEVDKDFSPLTIETFINTIKDYDKWLGLMKGSPTYWAYNEVGYTLGDLGKVYGYQWRNQNGVDQIKEVIEGLKSNPYSRYHIIDGWNKADFKEMALPPCHLLYQFIVRPMTHEEKIQWVMKNTDVEMENLYIYEETLKESTPQFYLDLNMYQRSVDTFLGASFNLASMSLLLLLFAKASNMVAGVATWIGGDTHLYVSHIPMANEQLKRKPFPLPEMKINKELNSLDDILKLNINDFELINYLSHDSIKAELFTGLKK
jgi:thymidylate synthase